MASSNERQSQVSKPDVYGTFGIALVVALTKSGAGNHSVAFHNCFSASLTSKQKQTNMLDQLMDLMNLDDVLDVSLAADEKHELLNDDGCDDDLLLPHLVQESFASRESDDGDVEAGAADSDNDDDERMDVDDSHDCSEEWEECGEVGDGQREAMTEDIQWDPVPFVPLESSSYHDCHTGGTFDCETRSSEPVDAAISHEGDIGASSLPPSPSVTDGSDREIQWMPPAAATATTDERSSSSRSLQPEELYERSRQRLVASMMRSQESRRHIQRRNQMLLLSSSRRPHLLSSSLTIRGRSLGDMDRSEMISSFGRDRGGRTDDDNTRSSRPGLYSSSSCHNFAAV
jgi:hypothetical protein